MTKDFTNSDTLYDMKTFYGRFQHFRRQLDPTKSLITDEVIREYQSNIKEFTDSKNSKFSQQELWSQYYTVKAHAHPETGELPNRIQRLCNFLPSNAPIIFGLCVLPPTPMNQVIFQTLNQTYNFSLNIAFASSSNPVNMQEIAVSYVCCIASALTVAVVLRKKMQSQKSQNPVIKAITFFTPYIAACTANSVNHSISRWKDFAYGVEIIGILYR